MDKEKVINTSCKAHIFSINFASSEEQRLHKPYDEDEIASTEESKQRALADER